MDLRRIVVALAAVGGLLVAAPSSYAGDCVVGRDAAGDARPLPGDAPAEHDLLELATSARADKTSFQLRLLATPAPAVPGRQLFWFVHFRSGAGGPIRLTAVRDAAGDHASVSYLNDRGSGVTKPVPVRINDAARTVTIDLPYTVAPARPGVRLTAFSAEHSAAVGTSIPGAPPAAPSNFGLHVNVYDDVRGDGDVVIGRACA